jgi:hypothetical protein
LPVATAFAALARFPVVPAFAALAAFRAIATALLAVTPAAFTAGLSVTAWLAAFTGFRAFAPLLGRDSV